MMSNIAIAQTGILDKCKHTFFCCAVLYCTLEILFFSKLKVCGSPVLSESIGAIFPAVAHFMAVSYFGDPNNIRTFSLLYLLW